jgi:hypothetical protein
LFWVEEDDSTSKSGQICEYGIGPVAAGTDQQPGTCLL